MGGKKDAAKKGAVAGGYKAGKPHKDILPANSKAPREPVLARLEGEPEVTRQYEFEPLQVLPEWPGNDEAKNHDFKAGFEQDADGNWSKFTEPEPVDGVGAYHLPPSFADHCKGEPTWMRPEEYIREILYEQEVQKRRKEKKRELKLRKATKQNSLMALAQQTTVAEEEEMQKQVLELEQLQQAKQTVNKDDIVPEPKVICYLERLETEHEVAKRKEAAEKAAAADKGSKKKAPAKGAPAGDPADEPQLIQVPVDGSLDMSFSMPTYTKWVTSQFQFVRDRTIRDVDSNEAIWQRIYPQENGIPKISPTGKYWVKLRFMGKERLVEIDDRVPCSAAGQPIFPRTCDPNEIWPQLLMKALLKVYSYKWYAANCHYDSEIGDGSVVYSLTGLIPEKVPIRGLDQAQGLFRKYLADDCYFGKRAYVTAYCENDWRPRFPSQVTALKGLALNATAEPGSGNNPRNVSPTRSDGMSDTESVVSGAQSSSKLMLSKLKDAASLAISVTTGRKPAFGAKEKNLTNIIPGFGYALMDVFENEFVDMDSVVKQNTQIIEENASPFASPAKSKSKRDKSMSKDEYRKFRREQRKKELEEFERREQEPPKQYAFVKIKTSIGKHPVINYLSTFTNDEIMEGKKYKLNHWRRDPTRPMTMPYRSPSPGRRGDAAQFKIDVSDAVAQDAGQDAVGPSDVSMKTPAKNARVDVKDALLPKTRGAGGLWLTQSDFPHAFQSCIVYHNLKKYQHNELHQDIWDNPAEPYIANDKEIYIKLELDPEAVERVEAEQLANKYIGVQKVPGFNSIPDSQRSGPGEESKEQSALEEAAATQRSADRTLLPGEHDKPKVQHDNIIIACAPYPTNKAHETLPRYMTRIKQVDCELPDASEKNLPLINQNYRSYFEGCQFKVLDEMSTQSCIWLKPEFNCPQGATLWIASQLRKIKIMSKVEYLQEQKEHHVKQVTFDYSPMQADKYQMLAKYDFVIPEPEGGAPATTVQLKVDMPADRYLLNYMRLKIIDRTPTQDGDLTETSKVSVINQVNLCNLKLPPNGPHGYTLIVEGVFPYNTAEGQMVIETLSNNEAFQLTDVTQCEPVEYSDAYTPTKYGIIFKEKIVISPVDHTSASLNIKLLKGDTEFAKLGQVNPADGEEIKEGELQAHKPRYFRIDVLDNGKTIYTQTGYDQITLSHFMFRCNQGLPEQASAEGGEVKHNYVIQALFDLHEWPECKTLNEQSQDVSWCIKVYSSETLCLIKDTDKEDRERELKASWEAEEPGRADKAKASRLKFLAKQKQRRGEELTEDEQAALNEKRERVRKKDQEDAPAAAKGGKGAKAPAKGGKAPPKGAPVPEEEEVVAQVVFPEAFNHVNNEIKEFLEHFASSRKIIVPAVSKQPRKRSDEQKQEIQKVFQEQVDAEKKTFTKISEDREAAKEKRADERELAFKDMDDGRGTYKDDLKQLVLEERNGYRDKIEARKAKESDLVDLIKQDKEKETMPRPDVNALKAAIEAAQEAQVKPKYIKKGRKYLEFMEYVIEFEGFIQQAVADKNKESLTMLLERVEHEGQVMGKGLPFEPKILADAKGNLAKMK